MDAPTAVDWPEFRRLSRLPGAVVSFTDVDLPGATKITAHGPDRVLVDGREYVLATADEGVA